MAESTPAETTPAQTPTPTPTAAAKGTKKRDRQREIEREMQRAWSDAHLHETSAPADWVPGKDRSKYLVTFPYPYMNGCLHLGHSFTVTKAEFAARYEKLKGKNALFPFGFHCTGMPIKACADKLRQEIEKYGNPPVFPVEEAATTPSTSPAPAAATKPAKAGAKKPGEGGDFHGRKAKVAQKTVKRQWDILLSNGVAPEKIPEFVDPMKWLSYFPPVGRADLETMGVAVDWRRSFITTDANPFYDSFVRWQFETLRALGKVDFGKRYTIYSPLDKQACADHERADEGQGVIPQEYTLIKMEVVPGHCDVPEKLRPIIASGKKVFLVAGTLRPETMYGQTNCWALPEGKYGAYEANEKEVFVCMPRAARNMAYQELSRTPNTVSCLAEIDGTELIGTPLRAPLAKYDVVHVLPMCTISPEKSTGIVTSVPSDSPDDYTNFVQLKNKPEYRKKLGVKDEWVMPYEIVPIINIPEYGTVAAETVCAELKVNGPNDHEKLEKAKEATYLKGFYTGEMIVGPHKGTKVKDAKPLVRDELIAQGLAATYAEPASRVMSRTGDECVVALLDQWYLTYGEPNWRAATEAHVKNMEFYHNSSLEMTNFALGWMNQWACSRNFGLGTRLPWDEQYLIESLSDSTIYMAYYTVAHLIQGGSLDASSPNALGIRPEQMTRAAWDHVFLGKPVPADCTPQMAAALATMRKEFEYWYPMDLRVSGKDLLQNHLLFCLYNHSAVFPESLGPRAFRANGHLLLNGDKMAKSTGNFLTLREGVEEYSADGMRLALADAGDSVDDANFVRDTADAALLRISNMRQWIEEMTAPTAQLSDDTDRTFFDRVFENSMNWCIAEADRAYSRAMYREALLRSFFDMQAVRDAYRSACDTLGVQMKRALVLRFAEVQALLLAPIAPHFADDVWRRILKRDGFVWSHGRWPQSAPVDAELRFRSEYIDRILTAFRIAIIDHCDPVKNKKKNKGASTTPPPQPTEAEIVLATAFPDWTVRTYAVINALFAKEGKYPATDALIAEFHKDPVLKANMKKAMSKAGFVGTVFAEAGKDALSLDMKFNERQLVEDHLAFFTRSLRLQKLTIRVLEATDEKVVPGTPGFNIIH